MIRHTRKTRRGDDVTCDLCGNWILTGDVYRQAVRVGEEVGEYAFSLMYAHDDCGQKEGWSVEAVRDAAQNRLDEMNRLRGTSFRIGQRIEVDGKPGTIVGANSSANLDVRFDGEKHASNCHPEWRVREI